MALATCGSTNRLKDNPHHWQTLILLIPLVHNQLPNGMRIPVSPAMIQRTLNEMREMFSGYTLSKATGWYWDQERNTGVSDELIRCEIDGAFTGYDLRLLNAWRKKLLRRFRQNYIYMRLIASGVAI